MDVRDPLHEVEELFIKVRLCFVISDIGVHVRRKISISKSGRKIMWVRASYFELNVVADVATFSIGTAYLTLSMGNAQDVNRTLS